MTIGERTQPSRSFTVHGARNGSLVTVTWTDGHLSGDFPTIDLAQIQGQVAGEAAEDNLAPDLADLHRRLGPDPLAHPETAYLLLEQVIDRITRVTGDVPASISTGQE
ncbi:hypothetical protein FTX61_09915 [Nitriliruptoraceae bacterium ZYF776]|nr:hypothetical protein [Profundirhabdus halotolerans]